QHDPSDGQGLTRLAAEVADLEAQVATHEERWLELTELMDA
ncbi:MAG: hypothetical protein JWP56_3067, partial [Aeromicrobium sp.]|nr:hypothetical protein [Aeromicrobium sp.]